MLFHGITYKGLWFPHNSSLLIHHPTAFIEYLLALDMKQCPRNTMIGTVVTTGLSKA